MMSKDPFAAAAHMLGSNPEEREVLEESLRGAISLPDPIVQGETFLETVQKTEQARWVRREMQAEELNAIMAEFMPIQAWRFWEEWLPEHPQAHPLLADLFANWETYFPEEEFPETEKWDRLNIEWEDYLPYIDEEDSEESALETITSNLRDLERAMRWYLEVPLARFLAGRGAKIHANAESLMSIWNTYWFADPDVTLAQMMAPPSPDEVPLGRWIWKFMGEEAVETQLWDLAINYERYYPAGPVSRWLLEWIDAHPDRVAEGYKETLYEIFE
ncbi:Uncharacterised protein [Actinobaculum suis]|uniref:Uncharacterized protein n=1 Tax=Actinobaculum suis TaxID=1657 RepID=A0A7Z8Y897_9ACTO|nr:hypothetical protein [Actinobaculum suis]VDG75795.1 Uncharacterised protein [Actinobaculum suis]